MRILVLFGSSEGHTSDLARFAAGVLEAQGFEVFTMPARGKAQHLSLIGWDGIIVAASLHGGGFQRSVVRFVRRHRQALSRVPNAFVSVSLSAAGHDPGDWSGLGRCIAELEQKTFWIPETVHHVAGALRFSRYGFLKGLVMKFIARQRGLRAERGRDYDLTDYGDFREFLLSFAATVRARRRQAAGGVAADHSRGPVLPEQVWSECSSGG